MIASIGCLAVALFAAAFFHGREVDLARQIALAREQLRTQSIALTRSNEALVILRAPDTRVFSFGGEHPLEGAIFASQSQGILLVAYGLAPAAPGKVYQMWLVPRHGMPRPAGVFAGTADSTALHVYKETVDLAAIASIEVTLETQPGAGQPASQPAGTPVIRAQL